jgi:hypothetical protein
MIVVSPEVIQPIFNRNKQEIFKSVGVVIFWQSLNSEQGRLLFNILAPVETKDKAGSKEFDNLVNTIQNLSFSMTRWYYEDGSSSTMCLAILA